MDNPVTPVATDTTDTPIPPDQVKPQPPVPPPPPDEVKPQPPVPPPPPPDQQMAENMVALGLQDAHDLAQEATTRGMAALQALSGIDIQIPEIVAPAIDLPPVAPLSSAVASEHPDDSTLLPGPPQAPTLPAPLALDVGEAPHYDLVPPLLIEVPLPDPFDLLPPDAPQLADVGAPSEPDFTLPAVPDLASLALPDTPTFEVPTFTDTLPDGPAIPDLTLTWHEIGYHSDLLATMNNRLLTFVQGEPSSLPEEVERRIWDDAVDDEVAATWKATDDAFQSVAARGFNLPGGEVLRLVQVALDAGLKQDVEASRQLMVAQARMELANFMFAFSNAMQLENQQIALFNQVQQRALDAARFRVESAMSLFDARVNLYQADVTAFGAKAEVFKARLTAVLSRLDVYKAELEAVKARGQLNLQLAQQYAAQIDGVKVIADVYRARVSAVSLAVANNKNRTELYKSQIDGAAARARAGAQAVQGYLSQVQQESNKSDLFAAQVAGYGSRVEAYKVLTDARLSGATVSFKQLQQFPMEVYKTQLAAKQAAARTESARLSASAEKFNAEVEIYAATQRAAGRHIGAQAETAIQQSKVQASSARIALMNSVFAQRAEMAASDTADTAVRAANQVATQRAAAAASARNHTASFSSNVSNSTTTNVSNTTSFSSGYSKSDSFSKATNFSVGTSETSGGVSSTNNSQTFSDNETISESSNRSNSEVVSNSSVYDKRSDIRNNVSSSVARRQEATTQTIYNHKE